MQRRHNASQLRDTPRLCHWLCHAMPCYANVSLRRCGFGCCQWLLLSHFWCHCVLGLSYGRKGHSTLMPVAIVIRHNLNLYSGSFLMPTGSAQTGRCVENGRLDCETRRQMVEHSIQKAMIFTYYVVICCQYLPIVFFLL